MSKSTQAFRTIREVADWLGVAAHVLRFWESKFPQIKPVKRAGGRRYYRPADMELVGGIKVLLHDQGLTIRGVQKMMAKDGIEAVSALSPPFDAFDTTDDVTMDADAAAWAADAASDAAPSAVAQAPQAEPDPPQAVLPLDAAAPSNTPVTDIPETPAPRYERPDDLSPLRALVALANGVSRVPPEARDTAARACRDLEALRDRMRADPGA